MFLKDRCIEPAVYRDWCTEAMLLMKEAHAEEYKLRLQEYLQRLSRTFASEESVLQDMLETVQTETERRALCEHKEEIERFVLNCVAQQKQMISTAVTYQRSLIEFLSAAREEERPRRTVSTGSRCRL